MMDHYHRERKIKTISCAFLVPYIIFRFRGLSDTLRHISDIVWNTTVLFGAFIWTVCQSQPNHNMENLSIIQRQAHNDNVVFILVQNCHLTTLTTQQHIQVMECKATSFACPVFPSRRNQRLRHKVCIICQSYYPRQKALVICLI